jgi:hypothetical protein
MRLDSIVGNMMHTRRLHARLAYVMCVDNRASIAYAASARSVRRGLLSPELLMRSLSSQCHASLIKKLRRSARAINVKALVLATNHASTLRQSLITRKL